MTFFGGSAAEDYFSCMDIENGYRNAKKHMCIKTARLTEVDSLGEVVHPKHFTSPSQKTRSLVWYENGFKLEYPVTSLDFQPSSDLSLRGKQILPMNMLTNWCSCFKLTCHHQHDEKCHHDHQKHLRNGVHLCNLFKNFLNRVHSLSCVSLIKDSCIYRKKRLSLKGTILKLSFVYADRNSLSARARAVFFWCSNAVFFSCWLVGHFAKIVCD